MSKRFGLVFSVLAIFASTTLLAQTVPVVDRGLTQGEGKGEVGLDFQLGLDKDKVAKRFGTYSSNISDRYEGLSFAYGLMNELDLGLAIFAINYEKDPGLKFGGGYLYGKYAFAEFIGAELGVRFPGEKFSDNRVSIILGVPFKYVLSPGQFALHARPDLVVGLAKPETPQLNILFTAGGTFNATPELFFDLSFGTEIELKPTGGKSFGDRVGIPISLTAGYTVMPELDIYLAFALNNLKPAEGKAFDYKDLSLGASFRF